MGKITARTLADNPELRTAYLRWLEHEDTKLFLSIVEDEMKRPLGTPLHQLRAEPALALFGQQCGAAWAIGRLRSLTDETPDRADLVPTWGAEDILKEHGIISGE